MALLVLNVVGLTANHIGSDTPHLQAFAMGGTVRPLIPPTPAVTTTAQTTMLTGASPEQHGIVGNGWFFDDLGEILFWRQSEALVQAPYFWQNETTAPKVLKHFWWYAMNSRSCSHLITPRPAYHADGRKSPDFYAHPAHLHDTLESKHGPFPLFSFWGPTANIASSRWIADSFQTAVTAAQPDIALCYLPHLDYDLQRFGPTGEHLPSNLREIDACCGDIIQWAHGQNHQVVVVSEYGIESVTTAGFLNRALRQAGLLAVTKNATGELLDPGASKAFAVCDHQIAHIYCHNRNDIPAALQALSDEPSIEATFVGEDRKAIGLNHPRAGTIVAIAQQSCWFAHDYWLDTAAAPDFTHLVEIHKKPGYDPRELHFRPGGKLRAAKALLKKKLGFRYLMDAITTDPTSIQGSHGRLPTNPLDGPVLVMNSSEHMADTPLPQTDVAHLLKQQWLAK